MKVPEPRKLDSGTWFIQLRLGGESVPVTASTEKECRDKATLIKAEYKAGKKKLIALDSKLTLSQAIDNYINTKSNTLSPSTLRGYRTIQNNRFSPVMNKPISSVNDWQSVCNTEAKLCSPKTLKNAWHFVASVLRENQVDFTKVALPQVPEFDSPWLEPDQISIFVKAVEGQSCEIPALLALLSLRRSEICALTWENIDLKKKFIAVKGSMVPDETHKFVIKNTTKTKASNRIVPIMIPALLTALEKVENKTGNVVSGSPNTIAKRINNICTNAGLPCVGVHGLRHSFASLGYHLNMPEKQCMLIGGWTDSGTMHKIYTHLAAKDTQKYENAMADFYKNANRNANKNSQTL